MLFVVVFLLGVIATLIATLIATRGGRAADPKPPQTVATAGVTPASTPDPDTEKVAADAAQLADLDRDVASYNSACRRVESTAEAADRYDNELMNDQSLGSNSEWIAQDHGNLDQLGAAIKEAESLLQKIRQNPLTQAQYRFGATLGLPNELPAVRNAAGGQGSSYLDKI